jgi:hypothetical protein
MVCLAKFSVPKVWFCLAKFCVAKVCVPKVWFCVSKVLFCLSTIWFCMAKLGSQKRLLKKRHCSVDNAPRGGTVGDPAPRQVAQDP